MSTHVNKQEIKEDDNFETKEAKDIFNKELNKINMEKEKNAEKNDKAGKIIAEEDRSIGEVRWSVWKSYFWAIGGFFVVVILCSFFMDSTAKLSADVWLSLWSSDPEKGSLAFNLGLYTFLCFISGY